MNNELEGIWEESGRDSRLIFQSTNQEIRSDIVTIWRLLQGVIRRT